MYWEARGRTCAKCRRRWLIQDPSYHILSLYADAFLGGRIARLNVCKLDNHRGTQHPGVNRHLKFSLEMNFTAESFES